MSIELKMLLYAIVLLILQLLMQTLAGMIQHGIGYTLSPHDDYYAGEGYAGRIERAFYNMLETFPVFAALALMVHVTQSWNSMTGLGAQIYFWSRVIYVPLYVAGVPVLRTLIWIASIVGMGMMAWPMILPLAGY